MRRLKINLVELWSTILIIGRFRFAAAYPRSVRGGWFLGISTIKTEAVWIDTMADPKSFEKVVGVLKTDLPQLEIVEESEDKADFRHNFRRQQ